MTYETYPDVEQRITYVNFYNGYCYRLTESESEFILEVIDDDDPTGGWEETTDDRHIALAVSFLMCEENKFPAKLVDLERLTCLYLMNNKSFPGWQDCVDIVGLEDRYDARPKNYDDMKKSYETWLKLKGKAQ